MAASCGAGVGRAAGVPGAPSLPLISADRPFSERALTALAIVLKMLSQLTASHDSDLQGPTLNQDSMAGPQLCNVL